MFNSNHKDFLLLSIGKVIQVFIGLITIRLITEMLSEEQVGLYYVLLTLTNLLAFGFFNPLGQYYGRNLIYWEKTGNIKTATVTMLALRVMAIPFATITAIIIFYALDYSQYFSIVEYTVFIFVAMVALIHGVLLSATNVLVNRVVFIVIAVLTLVIGLLLSLFLVKKYESAIAWMYGLASVQILMSIYLYVLIVSGHRFSKSKVKAAFSKKHVRKVKAFILPVTITLFLQWGQTTSFRLIVEDLYSAKALASIAVGMAISSSIFKSFETLSTQFYMPIYLKRITGASSHKRTDAWNQLGGIMLPLYLGLTIYVIALAPFLVKLLVADKFQNIVTFVMIGATVEFFRVSSNIVYLVSQSEINTRGTIIPYLVGFTIMVLSLYAIDVSQWFWGVPMILAYSYCITLIIMFLRMRKLLPIQLDLELPLKMALSLSPLFFTLLIDITINKVNALLVVTFSGSYLLAIYYFLMKKKINEMSYL